MDIALFYLSYGKIPGFFCFYLQACSSVVCHFTDLHISVLYVILTLIGSKEQLLLNL